MKNFKRTYSLAILFIVFFFIILFNICLIPTKESAKCAHVLLANNNTIISTSWEDSTSQYMVYHYKETMTTGVYSPYYENCDEGMSGTIGSLTNAKTKSYNGFTAEPFEQAIIKGDGSTVVEIYYKRNIYKLNYKSVNTVLCSYEVKYGDDISDITYTGVPPEREGYTFLNWSPRLYNEMPENDVDITAVWELNAPVIVKGSDVTKIYGTAVELSCEVSNCLDSITTYKWYKGEQKVGQSKTLSLINVADSGTYSLKVIVNDGVQTKGTNSGEIIVIIEKAIYDTSGITFENKEVVYDGNAHSVEIGGSLANGITVSYINNSGTEIGTYEAIAHFEAGENYEEIADMRATLKIVSAPKNNQDEDIVEEEKPNIIDTPNSISITEQQLLGERLNLNITDVCTVSLDKETLTKIRTKANFMPVTIIVNPIDNAISIEKFGLSATSKIYNLSLLIGSEFVEFEGSALLSIPYTLNENEKVEDIKVWSIQNDTLNEIENVSYQNGFVSFTANNFSDFAIDTVIENQSDIKSQTILIVGAVSIVCIVLISFIVIKNAKKKKK